jgi:hypothetical protein
MDRIAASHGEFVIRRRLLATPPLERGPGHVMTGAYGFTSGDVRWRTSIERLPDDGSPKDSWSLTWAMISASPGAIASPVSALKKWVCVPSSFAHLYWGESSYRDESSGVINAQFRLWVSG